MSTASYLMLWTGFSSISIDVNSCLFIPQRWLLYLFTAPAISAIIMQVSAAHICLLPVLCVLCVLCVLSVPWVLSCAGAILVACGSACCVVMLLISTLCMEYYQLSVSNCMPAIIVTTAQVE